MHFIIVQGCVDVDERYPATPMDAMQLLIMRRLDHALLAEPAVSMALRRAVSSILLFCALWELGGRVYGALILPGPVAAG